MTASKGAKSDPVGWRSDEQGVC